MNLLEINNSNDIKQMDIAQLEQLADDIREFIIDSVSQTGGHLSSNLGIVELTIALHYVFDSSKDKMIFDVGHQAYTHKILTGRAKDFPNLRKYKGLSGFQKRHESISDPWEAGHSSTSLSAGLGFSIARDLSGDDYQVISILGDGALSSGMSFEALNQIGYEHRKMIIVLNDNEMSISQNVGAISKALTDLRVSKGYNVLKRDLNKSLHKNKLGEKVYDGLKAVKDSIKGEVVDSYFFDEFNVEYLGPIDGHDLKEMIKVFESIKDSEGPIVVHVKTKKGKGYSFAENDKTGKYHGIGRFDKESGKSLASLPINHISWSQVLCNSLVNLSQDNEDIVVLTPAMKNGSKLQDFEKAHPDRFFDCGIAEEHTLTMAAALAANGKRPFVSVYSSFMQRAYDSINHDICRMDLPVVIGVDRAGLVGEDGETHHGVFDISMCRSIPNLIISQPKDASEAQNLMYTAFNQQHPMMIRIPRGNVEYHDNEYNELLPIGSWTKEIVGNQPKVSIITYGDDVDKVIQKAKINEIDLEIINARFIKPLDEKMLKEVLSSDNQVIIYETDMAAGGLSSAILEFANDHGYHKKLHRIGIGDNYVEQGAIAQLRKEQKIDLNTLFDLVNEVQK